MNKYIFSLILCLLVSAIAFTQPVRAYVNVNQGCTACHDFSTLHAKHSDCMKCHDGAVSKGTVYPSACATCHPSSSPGTCNLIKKHEDNPRKTCLGCHTDCSSSSGTTTAPSSTTTSISASTTTTAPPSCIDTDNDGYGDNCPSGEDCNDSDAEVNPDAEELCDDGIDNNCDGQIDEDCPEGPCPAAAVLEKDDSRIETIRLYRDKVMAKSAVGKKLIRLYYANSAEINAAFATQPALKNCAAAALNLLLPFIEKQCR